MSPCWMPALTVQTEEWGWGGAGDGLVNGQPCPQSAQGPQSQMVHVRRLHMAPVSGFPGKFSGYQALPGSGDRTNDRLFVSSASTVKELRSGAVSNALHTFFFSPPLFSFEHSLLLPRPHLQLPSLKPGCSKLILPI